MQGGQLRTCCSSASLFNIHLPPYLARAGMKGLAAFLCCKDDPFMKYRILYPLWLIVSLKVKDNRPDS